MIVDVYSAEIGLLFIHVIDIFVSITCMTD